MAAARRLAVTAFALASAVALLIQFGVVHNGTGRAAGGIDPTVARGDRLIAQGRNVFRYDTFGDQAVWGGVLGLHKAIEGAKLGGVGPGVSPKTALALGLKVDSTKIPRQVAAAIKAGKVDLDDPAVTVTLLKLNAVVGVKGFFNQNGSLSSVGITCAVCHSTVDDSFAPGIGKRLDGWPNQDLNVGAIVASAPNLKPLEESLHADEPTVKKVLLSWGPGKFDAELDLDGRAFRPDGESAATRIPSAFGKDGQNLHTWEGGWGTVTYWNAFVANLEMHGTGNFYDPRLDDKAKFPLAAVGRFGHTHPYVGEGGLPVPYVGAGRVRVREEATGVPDRITEALRSRAPYQRSLPVPRPPNGSFD